MNSKMQYNRNITHQPYTQSWMALIYAKKWCAKTRTRNFNVHLYSIVNQQYTFIAVVTNEQGQSDGHRPAIVFVHFNQNLTTWVLKGRNVYQSHLQGEHQAISHCHGHSTGQQADFWSCDQSISFCPSRRRHSIISYFRYPYSK